MLFILIIIGSICGLCSIPMLFHFYNRLSKLVKLLKDNDITF